SRCIVLSDIGVDLSKIPQTGYLTRRQKFHALVKEINAKSEAPCSSMSALPPKSDADADTGGNYSFVISFIVIITRRQDGSRSRHWWRKLSNHRQRRASTASVPTFSG